MNLFALRSSFDKVSRPFISRIGALPVSANQWTAVGAVLGLVGGVVFFYGFWWAGLVLLLVRGLIDHVDGYVARNYNQRSVFGAVMDDVCDRWVLGVMYAGGCLNVSYDYPHVLIMLGLGITGALTNVIIKLSIYAEAGHDLSRATGKTGHPIDVVGVFGSAEFIVFFGAGALFTALLHDARAMVAGIWAVVLMSHISLLQRIAFAWRRYRFVDPQAAHNARAAANEGLVQNEGAALATNGQAKQT